MQGPSNRSVVIISGLLTLLVLGGATRLDTPTTNIGLQVTVDLPRVV